MPRTHRDRARPLAPVRAAFFVEAHLGHLTLLKGLQQSAAEFGEIEPLWFPLHPRPAGLHGRLPAGVWSLEGSARARRLIDGIDPPPEALFVHTQSLGLLSAGALRRIPSVVSTDGTPRGIAHMAEHWGEPPGNPRAEAIKDRIVGRPFHAANAVVTWTEMARRSVIEDYGVAADRVRVIYPGVDIGRLAAPARAPEPGRPTRILFVGGDFERKGGELVLDALSQLERWELDVVTRAPLPPAENRRVHRDLTPDDPRLLELFRSCDLLVLPTYADTSPLVIAEAMAAGLPVIASRVGAIPSMVEHGVSGLLVDTGDAEALTGALRRLLDDPEERIRMGAAGLERARRDYDRHANSTALFELLVDLARAGR